MLVKLELLVSICMSILLLPFFINGFMYRPEKIEKGRLSSPILHLSLASDMEDCVTQCHAKKHCEDVNFSDGTCEQLLKPYAYRLDEKDWNNYHLYPTEE